MQDWILTHTIRNHVPAWTEIVIPCPCQGHQPRGTPPGPHPPGGAPVLTDPTIFIHLIYAITLTNTYFTHHLCYRRYVNYCIHRIQKWCQEKKKKKKKKKAHTYKCSNLQSASTLRGFGRARKALKSRILPSIMLQSMHASQQRTALRSRARLTMYATRTVHKRETASSRTNSYARALKITAAVGTHCFKENRKSSSERKEPSKAENVADASIT